MSAMEQPRRLLGLLLIEMGVITPEQLDEALEIQAETGERLGEILVDRGFTSRLAIHDALAEQSELFLEPESGYGTGLRAQLVKREGRGKAGAAEGSSEGEQEAGKVVFLHPEEASDEMGSLLAALDEKDQQLEARAEEQRGLREELETLLSERAAQEERHAELEGLLAEREEQLEARAEEHRGLREELEALRSERAAQGERHAELEGLLAEREEQLAARAKELRESREEVETLRSERAAHAERYT